MRSHRDILRSKLKIKQFCLKLKITGKSKMVKIFQLNLGQLSLIQVHLTQKWKMFKTKILFLTIILKTTMKWWSVMLMAADSENKKLSQSFVPSKTLNHQLIWFNSFTKKNTWIGKLKVLRRSTDRIHERSNQSKINNLSRTKYLFECNKMERNTERQWETKMRGEL